MNNLDVRILVSDLKIKYRDIADEMNVSREWLSRLMRKPLTPDNKLRILTAIEKLTSGDQKSEIIDQVEKLGL